MTFDRGAIAESHRVNRVNASIAVHAADRPSVYGDCVRIAPRAREIGVTRRGSIGETPSANLESPIVPPVRAYFQRRVEVFAIFAFSAPQIRPRERARMTNRYRARRWLRTELA